MDPLVVDQIQLNFNRTGLTAVNTVIGLMMFGVALFWSRRPAAEPAEVRP